MSSVAEVIEEHRESIVAEWAVEARVAASAKGLNHPDLLDIMPTYLAAFGARGASPARRRALLENHLSARLREGFRVDEVIEEFAILERCIAER